MSERVWVLSPTDLGGLWDECRRCFYLAVAAGFPRPASAPSSLDAIARAHIAGLDRRRTDQVAAGMPPGTIDLSHRSVQSEPLSVQVPEHSYRFVIRGALDVTLTLEDGTLGVAEIAVVGDTTGPAASRRQHAWAQALESAGAGKVSVLGTLVFVPGSTVWTWTAHERDDPGFYGFLAEALSLLARPAPPGGTPLCAWCVYRDASRRTGY